MIRLAANELSAVASEILRKYPKSETERAEHWIMGTWLAMLSGKLTPENAPKPASPTMKPRLIYFDGLDERCWFEPEEIECTASLERAFPQILGELEESVGHAGWRAYSAEQTFWHVQMISNRAGQRDPNVSARFPKTTHVLDTLGVLGFGETGFSRLTPGSNIAPHHGLFNGLLVGHLPLIIPEGDCGIRVGPETRRWTPGRCLVFSEAHEHTAWNNTERDRYCLLFSVWHPDLTQTEQKILWALYPHTQALFSAVEPREPMSPIPEDRRAAT